MLNKQNENKLTNENINLTIQNMEEFLNQMSVNRRNVIRFKLMIEEILLTYQEIFGNECLYTYENIKRFSRPRILIKIKGESINPFEYKDEENSMLQKMLVSVGLAPNWQYRNGFNVITLSPEKEKKHSPILTLLFSVVLACIMGGLCTLLPSNFCMGLSEQVVQPVFGMFMGLISAVAGPLVFLSVLWGIFSIGDIATFGSIGKKMVLHFLFMIFGLTIISGCAVIPFFKMGMGDSGQVGFSELFKMILDIVPSNCFLPFSEGNSLQIIFIAIAIGVAMLFFNDKVTLIARFVEEANMIIQFIMKGVSSLVSVFVFCSLFDLIISGKAGVLLGSYKIVLMVLLSSCVVIIVYILIISIGKKVSPLCLIKKMLPAFLIGLTTASSAAAFATNVETCEKKLGIHKKMVDFGIPLGQVMFRPGISVQLFSIGIAMAEMYGMGVSLPWLAALILVSVMISIAAPPVPGGGLTCYTILVLQMGIPSEAVSIAVALNVIFEFVATATNIFSIQAELIGISGSLDMLDKDILRN